MKSICFRLPGVFTILTLSLVLQSCNKPASGTREQQLEVTAETLETKAAIVRQEVKLVAEGKNKKAEEIRLSKGDKASAELLDKDAEVTRTIGEKRAEQLEHQAATIREKKKQVVIPNPKL